MTSTVSNAVQRQQQAPRPTLVQVVQRMQPELARALPKHMDADRMARLALTVLRRDPKLSLCTPESFAGALLTAAALGLEPGVDGEAYLVPYGSECTFILGYRGYSKLFFQHPLARHLDAQAVYENDFFDYELGLDPYLKHKPAVGDRGKPVAFYAVASLTTGAKFFTVLSPEEVAAIRGASGKRKAQVDDPQHWMSRKTALRQLFHLVPKSTALTQGIQADERGGTELQSAHVPEQITSGADVIDTSTGEVTPAAVPDSDAPAEGELVDDAPKGQLV